MAGILSNGLVQTGLVLASPFLLPKALHAVQRYLNPSPAGTRAPLHPGMKATRPRPLPDDPRYAALRLFVLALGLSVCIFTALNPPHNLFLDLSPPRSLLQRLFPTLRPPVDLRVATETLAKAWMAHLRRDLTEQELALAQRLQTLDARLAYVAYGAGPLMGCSWCRPPGTTSAAGLLGVDYLLALAPGLAVAYLTVLAAMGVLLAGNGRVKYRRWAVVAVVVGGLVEGYWRLTWNGARGGIGGSVSMLHSDLHLLRSALFALLLLLSYFAPPSAPPSHPSTASIVAPAVASIAAQTESVLHRLRALSVLRMAVLHNDSYREKVTAFWSSASLESSLARSSPAVCALIEEQVQSAVKPFRAWLEGAMRPLGEVGAEEAEEGEEGEEGEETGEEQDGQEEGEERKEEPLTA
ncbi:hypothetical protein JCM8097_004310 [Rhodosporidiobolus ruineniae]